MFPCLVAPRSANQGTRPAADRLGDQRNPGTLHRRRVRVYTTARVQELALREGDAEGSGRLTEERSHKGMESPHTHTADVQRLAFRAGSRRER
jgi:hypothetical protein